MKWYIAIAVAGYIVALAFTAPAALLAEHLLAPVVSPEMLSLARVSGTLGSGGADLFVAGKGLGRGHWDFRPQSLLRGRLDFDFALDAQGGRLQTVVGVGLGQNVVLKGTQGQLSVARLRDSMPAQLRPWLAEGDLLLQLQTVELEAGRLTRLDGEAVWKDAEVGLAPGVNLGDLRLAATTGPEGTIQGVLGDGGGALECRGNLQLSADGAYRGDVRLGMRAGAPPSLGQALAVLGPRDRDGMTTLSLQGSLY